MVKVVYPLVTVLQMVDGHKMDMGYIYEAMDKAKEKKSETYKDRTKYMPI
jgi:predicted double-glycine peptidase